MNVPDKERNMKNTVFAVIICLTFSTGCESQQNTVDPTPAWQRPELKPYFMASDPEYWKTNLGKSISVKGVAVQSKMGARLCSKHGVVWIDGLGLWPENLCSKVVKVTGTVIKRHDGPELSKEQLEGQARAQGTAPRGKAHPEGSKELHEARRRYLLKDAKYMVVKEPGKN